MAPSVSVPLTPAAGPQAWPPLLAPVPKWGQPHLPFPPPRGCQEEQEGVRDPQMVSRITREVW